MANLRVYVLTKVLKAREFIYKCGNTVDGSKVEQILGEGSWVPTIVSSIGSSQFLTTYTCYVQNQFAKKLGPLGLDPFSMLVVDFMHECELGTWKALFTHLLRLLYALPGGDRLVAALDTRYTEFIRNAVTY
jgi:hypothetical protein